MNTKSTSSAPSRRAYRTDEMPEDHLEILESALEASRRGAAKDAPNKPS